MDSWEIGTSGVSHCHDATGVERDPSRDIDGVERARAVPDRFIAIHSSNDSRAELAATRTVLDVSPNFSQYQVWRKWGTTAQADSNPSASKRVSSRRADLAVAVQGDALIHGPRLVAQSVGSEWRIHRLHEINQIQSKEKTCIVI